MKSPFPFAQALHNRTGIGLLFCLAGGLGLHAQGPQLTLTPTLHNGYHITCFGKADGAIDLSVTGGTPPYTYDWTTGATTQDVTDLRAGYISVVVKDAANVQVRADMTLTEPRDLQADAVPYEYGNGYNVSCYECFNGNIQVTATDGAPPYTYAWVDGPTVEDRSQLGAGNYSVNVTDANGCLLKGSTITLREPDRTDWTMNGNAGTNPGTQYIGTSDNKDLVFKANGSESLRLKSNGDIKIAGSSTAPALLWRDGSGILRSSTFPMVPPDPVYPCVNHDFMPPFWSTGGNYLADYCSPEAVLGTLDEEPLRLVTNGENRIFITPDGKVGFGTEPDPGTIGQYRLFVEDGIVCRDVLVKHGDWPDFVFAKNYPLRSLGELRNYLKEQAHLPALPSAAELTSQGGMAVGDIVRGLTRTVEEQALYILQLEEKMQAMEQRLKAIEASNH